VRVPFAVLMVQYLLDRLAVAQWRERKVVELSSAVQALRSYYGQFQGVGLVANIGAAKMRDFVNTQQERIRRMDQLIAERNARLIISSPQDNNGNSLVRMTAADLGEAVRLGSELCRTYVESGDINREDEFWADRGLVAKDFEGLCVSFLKEAFGEQIVQPIEAADASGFRLEVDHVAFGKFFGLVMDARNMRDDLERVRVVDSWVFSERYPAPTLAVVTPQNALNLQHFENLVRM
jgi:hypothetical protein